MKIFRLTYRSTMNFGRIDSPLETLRSIVKTSAKRNAHHGLTGFLLFDGATFVQALEGQQPNVEETYERIARDPRHRDLTTLEALLTDARVFGSWFMGSHLRTREDKSVFERLGLSDVPLAAMPYPKIARLLRELGDSDRRTPQASV